MVSKNCFPINNECDEAFTETEFFNKNEGGFEMLKEIQNKFYNISRIMDCISCDKCRMNGKLQIRGLATVLKVLFVPDFNQQEMIMEMSNQEIVSVIQLLSKLSESI